MIHLRNEKEIDAIRESCRIVVGALRLAEEVLKEGVTAAWLDSQIEDYIRSQDARPAFKGFQGFPASACISLNDEVVHGIPKDTPIQPGTVVKVDVGVVKNGYYGDSARSFVVGEIDDDVQRLLQVTKEALYKGIGKAVAGNRLSDISHEIQRHVEANGFGVVRQLVGHGIGRELHEEPQIPNYGPPGRGPRLKAGMVLAIEPMVNMGTEQVITDDDGWTVRSADATMSAHFEHTIVVRDHEAEILTTG